MIEKIRKRDGSIVDFDQSKISNAIAKAVYAVRGGVMQPELDKLTRMVADEIQLAYQTGIADVEGVQDVVEICLMRAATTMSGAPTYSTGSGMRSSGTGRGQRR